MEFRIESTVLLDVTDTQAHRHGSCDAPWALAHVTLSDLVRASP